MIKDQEFALKLLRENGMAEPAQIEAARNAAIDAGSSDVVAELLNQKIVDSNELLSMLAQQYGMEVISLDDYDIPEEVIGALRNDYE